MSARRCAAIATLAMCGAGAAHAEVRGAFRLGVEPLALDASDDTPFVGDHVQDAVTAYNAASVAYNRAHGFAPGSAMASAPIDRSALGLHTTLLTFAPGIEAGTEHLKLRVEGLLGFSDRVHAVGVGFYPIDVSIPVTGSVTPYVVAGGTVRWLGRSDGSGATGGLATARAAAGARIGRHVVVELGCSVFMLGGVYDSTALDSMSSYDPRGAPPPAPDRVVSGGEQWGMIDISAGFVL